MLNPEKIVRWLVENGVTFATGVPDSVLSGFCWELTKGTSEINHVIACNEAAAVAAAIGWHVGTNTVPLVYLQNSGLGSAVNPLASLATAEVFRAPVLLLIGWRGKLGQSDEPQHKLMGLATIPILKSLGIPICKLPTSEKIAHRTITKILAEMRATGKSCALVVEMGAVGPSESIPLSRFNAGLWTGAEALRQLCRRMPPDDICVSTVGLVSRLLAKYREEHSQDLSKDLLAVGGMGLASQLALGLALATPMRRVWCLDGDGALLMHLGSLTSIGASKPRNFIHVLFNNGIHESVGGFPSANQDTGFLQVSQACGYKSVARAAHASDLDILDQWVQERDGPSFLELRVSRNVNLEVGRPKTSPQANKTMVMKFLEYGGDAKFGGQAGERRS
jgi:phosphonopyruvate decarboxylase